MSPPVSLYLFILRFLFSCPGVSTCSNRTSGPGCHRLQPPPCSRSWRSKAVAPKIQARAPVQVPALLHGVRDGPPLAAVEPCDFRVPSLSETRLWPSLVGGGACRSRVLKLEMGPLLSLSGWSHPLDLCRDLLRFSGPWNEPGKPGGGPACPQRKSGQATGRGGTEGDSVPKMVFDLNLKASVSQRKGRTFELGPCGSVVWTKGDSGRKGQEAHESLREEAVGPALCGQDPGCPVSLGSRVQTWALGPEPAFPSTCLWGPRTTHLGPQLGEGAGGQGHCTQWGH